ncbi:MAG: ion transporter [Candidatus Hydrothermarchaeales archaeon]
MERLWNWIVFLAAIFVVVSLILQVAYELPEEQEEVIEIVDVAVLGIFAVDLFKEYRNFKGSGKAFTRTHWLDILAIIPLFRVVRIARIAKVEKVAKLEEVAQIQKGAEAEEVVSKSVHTKHLQKEEEK